MKCAHCQAPKAARKWTLSACADNNRKRVAWLCGSCDVELNRFTLEFLRVPGTARNIAAYRGRQ